MTYLYSLLTKAACVLITDPEELSASLIPETAAGLCSVDSPWLKTRGENQYHHVTVRPSVTVIRQGRHWYCCLTGC